MSDAMGTGPSFELGLAQPRQKWAWLMLVLLFGLMVLGAVGSTFKPKKNEPPSVMNERMSVQMEVMRGYFAKKPTEAKGLASTLTKLSQKAPDSLEASRLLIATQAELRKPLDKPTLRRLAQSKADVDRAFAAVYSKPEGAAKLLNGLDSPAFEVSLAKVHALERAGDKTARDTLFPRTKWMVLGGAFGVVALALLLGPLLWVLYIAMRSVGKLRPLGHPEEPMSGLDADRSALRVVLILLALNLVPVALLWLDDLIVGPIAQAISAFAVLAVTVWLLHRNVFGETTSYGRLLGDTSKLGQKVIWGLAGEIALVPWVLLAAWLGSTLLTFLPEPSHPAVTELVGSKTFLTIAGVMLMAVVIAPLLEEVTFRGLLAPAIARVTGARVWGVVLSSLLFASIHPQGIVLWLALGLVGAMAAMLTYQTRSLIPAIVMHAVHNGALMTLNLLLF